MKPSNLFMALLLTGISILFVEKAHAQQVPTILSPANAFIQQRIDHSDPEGWLFFKNSSDLKAGELFSQNKTAAGLSPDDNMLLFETDKDAQGCTHNRYQQYYKNIKVEGGEFFEHLCDCYVYLMNGKIIEGLNFNAQSSFTAQQALGVALTHVGAIKYAWEDPVWEQELKDETENPNATYYPTGSIVLANLPGSSIETSNYRLAWKFEIIAIDPSNQKVIYIDANSGAVLKEGNMSRENGPAGTLYDGSQIIDTKWSGGIFHGHHHLLATDNGKNVETRNGSESDGWVNLSHVYDNDDIWGLDAPTVNVTSAHWVVTRSMDFFKDTYGRNGVKNKNNTRVKVFGNSTIPNTALYRRSLSDNIFDFIEFGTTDASNVYGAPAGINYASLDIGGHELTHGVTYSEANFADSGEPGALDESFADIFGVMVEGFARGGNFNWTIGEDLGFVIRDVQTPSASFRPQPTTYISDPLWINTVGCIPVSGLPPLTPAGNDRCGVHINSGVQNRWFYLLSQGGTQNGVTVQGIGMDKAARIAYHNLCNFLGSNANHPQSRLGAIASARILFGACSNEEVQTTNAWAAVGVGLAFSGNCVTLNGDRILCSGQFSFPYTYSAHAPFGATFTWSIPPTWTGTPSGPGLNTFSVTGFGNYNPPGGFPATEVISVTSSLGGTANIFVKVFDNCEWLCNESEERSKSEINNIEYPKIMVALSPNPTQNQIKVTCMGGSPKIISVLSSVGEALIEIVTSTRSPLIDVSKLSNGIYFVKVQFEDQTITKKFSKI